MGFAGWLLAGVALGYAALSLAAHSRGDDATATYRVALGSFLMLFILVTLMA